MLRDLAQVLRGSVQLACLDQSDQDQETIKMHRCLIAKTQMKSKLGFQILIALNTNLTTQTTSSLSKDRKSNLLPMLTWKKNQMTKQKITHASNLLGTIPMKMRKKSKPMLQTLRDYSEISTTKARNSEMISWAYRKATQVAVAKRTNKNETETYNWHS